MQYTVQMFHDYRRFRRLLSRAHGPEAPWVAASLHTARFESSKPTTGMSEILISRTYLEANFHTMAENSISSEKPLQNLILLRLNKTLSPTIGRSGARAPRDRRRRPRAHRGLASLTLTHRHFSCDSSSPNRLFNVLILAWTDPVLILVGLAG